MSNKVGRRKLSDFLSYEWIVMIVVILIAILSWELVFSFLSVRLNSGQVFEYYYDTNVSSSNDESLLSMFEKEGTFSFDVLDVYSTDNTAEAMVLSSRSATHELKAIFSDLYTSSKEGEYQSYSANKIIDVYSTYTYEYEDGKGGIVYAAKEYLTKFLKEENGNPLDYSQLDEQKIKDNFHARLNKDNRYRAGEISEQDECDRIKKLCEETVFMLKTLKYDEGLTAEQSLFYKYTKYQDALNTGSLADTTGYESEKECRYGLNVSRLTGGEKDTAQYFRLTDSEKKGDIVLLMFNYGIYHEDMQFETISFVNTIIRKFASIETVSAIESVEI